MVAGSQTRQPALPSKDQKAGNRPAAIEAARLSLRVDLQGDRRIGPGKIKLLEAIAATGSISGAGRELGMSYKRAWDLAGTLNRYFKEPVLVTHMGGRDRGGAEVTPFGLALIAHYRAIERKALAACAHDLHALDAALALTEPPSRPAIGTEQVLLDERVG
jgi:molybdate transport system regulatory protein